MNNRFDEHIKLILKLALLASCVWAILVIREVIFWKREHMRKGILKTLPALTSAVVAVGVVLLLVHREKIENKVATELSLRQIKKEGVPLQ